MQRTPRQVRNCALFSGQAPCHVWHERLGHPALPRILSGVDQQLFTGVQLADRTMPICVGCIHGKQQRLPFKSHVVHRVVHPLALVHSDVYGPFGHPAYGSNALQFVTFIDDYT